MEIISQQMPKEIIILKYGIYRTKSKKNPLAFNFCHIQSKYL